MSDPRHAAEPAPRRSPRRVLVAVALVVGVALAVTGGVAAWQRWTADAAAQCGTPVVQGPASLVTPGPTPASTPSPRTPTPSVSKPAVPASPSPNPAKPLAGKTVVVDPGHNAKYGKANRVLVPSGNGKTKACNSSGTATSGGWPEHTFNWLQANALADELRALGATVVLTRENDAGQGPCVNIRAATANEAGADVLISIHADGNLSKGARGFHVAYSTTMEGGQMVEKASKTLAIAARDALAADTQMPRSTYIGKGTALSPRSDLGTLNLLTKTPGIMLELGNMRNAADATLQRSAEFRQAVAKALAQAVVESI